MNASQLTGMRMVADAMMMPETMTAKDAHLCRDSRGASARGGKFKKIGARLVYYTEILYIGAATYIWNDSSAVYERA
jgi:hypothetical protein